MIRPGCLSSEAWLLRLLADVADDGDPEHRGGIEDGARLQPAGGAERDLALTDEGERRRVEDQLLAGAVEDSLDRDAVTAVGGDCAVDDADAGDLRDGAEQRGQRPGGAT